MKKTVNMIEFGLQCNKMYPQFSVSMQFAYQGQRQHFAALSQVN